jgi:hypothetical protein
MNIFSIDPQRPPIPQACQSRIQTDCIPETPRWVTNNRWSIWWQPCSWWCLSRSLYPLLFSTTINLCQTTFVSIVEKQLLILLETIAITRVRQRKLLKPFILPKMKTLYNHILVFFNLDDDWAERHVMLAKGEMIEKKIAFDPQDEFSSWYKKMWEELLSEIDSL